MKSQILKNMAIEECARLRFPNPQKWNPSDRQDAAWRETKVEIQRRAYIQGRKDEQMINHKSI
jgi:hypothetical protein